MSRFESEELIARGQTSTVWRGREISSGRKTAIKRLHEHLRGNPAIRQRLRREVGALRRLRHEGIVEVYDLIQEEESLALVLEYVEGETLRDYVRRRGPRSWEEAVEILDAVLGALEAAHQEGILHRDLNAEHVIIGPQGVKVVGFGMARVNELAALTMHTRVLGALEAMAPERVLGMEYDGRADLYSVGVLAHELLFGAPPVDGSMKEAFARASDREWRFDESRMKRDVNLPAAGVHFLERALLGDPATRFATAGQMRRALLGDYAQARWKGWEGRKSRKCPDCEERIIEGIGECISCGHQVQNLVQAPGRGNWSVVITTPEREPKGSETHAKGAQLTAVQLDQLMGVLKSYEDTEMWADGRWNYRFPPYVLLEELGEEDKNRVGELLRKAKIPHRMVEELNGKKFEKIGRTRVIEDLHLLGFWGMAFLTILFVGIGEEGDGLPLEIRGFALGMMTLGVLAGRLIAPRLYWRFVKRSSAKDGEEIPTMIGTEDLGRRLEGRSRELIPEGTKKGFSELGQRKSKQELEEIFSLAINAFHRGVKGVNRELMELILRAIRELDRISERGGERGVAELLRNLEDVEVRLQKASGKEGAREVDRRRRLLDELDEREEEERRKTLLSASLMSLRGALLDQKGREEEWSVSEEGARLFGILESMEKWELGEPEIEDEEAEMKWEAFR